MYKIASRSIKNEQANNKNFGVTKETFKLVIDSIHSVTDPGHGGIDVGATSVSGLYEKDFTFSLSKKVNEVLEKEERIQIYIINGYIDYKYRSDLQINIDIRVNTIYYINIPTVGLLKGVILWQE